jgi:tetratricopeptide (TPR) repeat protein
VWNAGVEHLRAEILLAEGRPDEARLAFEKIRTTPIAIIQPYFLVQRNMPYLHDIPGRTHAMKGRKDLAISLYERFVSSDPRTRELEIVHPFSRLELAKLYESNGDWGKAIAELEQLAKLWKNADQGLPQVEEARRRLAALRGSKG